MSDILVRALRTFLCTRTDDSKTKLRSFCRKKSQLAVSANYRGVRWSGNSLCVSSEYGLMLMCT